MPIVAYDHLVVRCNDIDAGVATYDGFGLELREPVSTNEDMGMSLGANPALLLCFVALFGGLALRVGSSRRTHAPRYQGSTP